MGPWSQIRWSWLVLVAGCWVGPDQLAEWQDRDNDGERPIEVGGSDCNDRDAAINAAANEVCGDGIDNDCDGKVDEDGEGAIPWFLDEDLDGYGVETASRIACPGALIEDGWATIAGDCSPGDPDTHPNAPERCNDLDDNCDGEPDEGLQDFAWYADADGDQHGDPSTGVEDCAPPDVLINWVRVGDDCNDADETVAPGIPDNDCNGVDNDCDGTEDQDNTDSQWWYQDADGDQYGDDASAVFTCVAPAGWVTAGGDCDDVLAESNPGLPEVCNGLDDNCDGQADEGLAVRDWFRDEDGDGYGLTFAAITTCGTPEGHAQASGDCDDESATINPGQNELCNDLDDDCDGLLDDGYPQLQWYADLDGDGIGDDLTITYTCRDLSSDGLVLVGGDCDDQDATAAQKQVWYDDGDGDGYGTGTPLFLCGDHSGEMTLFPGDCDDTNPATAPGFPEICDTQDNNCDEQADEGLPFLVYYPDTDEDGFGATSATQVSACIAPDGYVSTNTDCDDTSDTTFPGAAEVCGNGIDEDCGAENQCGMIGAYGPDTNAIGGAYPETYGYLLGVHGGWTIPDVSGDGLPDVVVSYDYDDGLTQSKRIAVAAIGPFYSELANPYHLIDGLQSPIVDTVGDMDGDGRAELIYHRGGQFIASQIIPGVRGDGPIPSDIVFPYDTIEVAHSHAVDTHSPAQIVIRTDTEIRLYTPPITDFILDTHATITSTDTLSNASFVPDFTGDGRPDLQIGTTSQGGASGKFHLVDSIAVQPSEFATLEGMDAWVDVASTTSFALTIPGTDCTGDGVPDFMRTDRFVGTFFEGIATVSSGPIDDGDTPFLEMTGLPGDPVTPVSMLDLNQDGHQDMLFRMSQNSLVGIQYNVCRPQPPLTALQADALISGVTYMSVASPIQDHTGDGKPNLVIVDQSGVFVLESKLD